MKKMILWVTLFALVFTLVGCGGEAGNHVIYFQGEQVPKNVDPLLATTQSERMVMENIYESLFRIDSQGKVIPAAALGYEFSADGKTCTVVLREGLSWSDGTAITPADFIFGLKRAVSPETKAPCGKQLTCIAGATEILAGKRSTDTLGVSASGNNTLSFSLTGKGEGLLAALAGPAGIPCNQIFFENCKGRYGTGTNYVLSNGLFQIKGWSGEEPDIFVRLIRSEVHRNAQSVRPSGVYFTFGTKEDGFSLLGEKKLDGTLISGELVSDATENGFTLFSHYSENYGLIMNTKGTKEMKNVSLRKALMGAVDKEVMAGYLPLSYERSDGIVLKDTYYSTQPYTQNGGLLLPLQETAQENFQKAVKELGAEALEDFQLWYVEQEGTRPVIDYLAQCWQKEFGLYVTLKAVSQSELWYGLSQGYCHIGVGRIAQQGSNSLEMLQEFSFAGEASSNGFTDKKFDGLLKTSKSSQKIEDQQQCEAYLLNQGYLLPLYTTKTYYAFAPGITDVTVDSYTRTVRLENAGKIQ